MSRVGAADPLATSVVGLGPGTFAYVQGDGGWGLNNSGFIVADDGIVVIDACATEARTLALRAAILGRGDAPIRTLVNTHHHLDHTYGNCLFPEATIVAHEACRDLIVSEGLSGMANRPEVEWGAIQLAPPSITFNDGLAIHCGDVRIELISYGPAHTLTDTVAWIPDQRVLFTGDLVFAECTPYIIGGSLVGTLHTLEAIRAFGADVTLVPGHGPVSDMRVVDDAMEYLTLVQEIARRGLEDGHSPLQAASHAALGRFDGWNERERLVGNLHRAYSELRGEALGCSLPFAEIYGEMIEFNGGPLRRHT